MGKPPGPCEIKREPHVLLSGRSRWVAFDTKGHFDTSNFDDTRDVYWIDQSAPINPLPLEAFLEEGFIPGLVYRRIAANSADSGEPLPPVVFQNNINPNQPKVTIRSVVLEPAPLHSATVTIDVDSVLSVVARPNGGKWPPSGMSDLRISRDGELIREVSISPSDGVPTSSGCSAVDGVTPDQAHRTVICRNLPLPACVNNECKNNTPQPDSEGMVEFVAYAFSSNGIKSNSSVFRLPFKENNRPLRNAYVVSFGVNTNVTLDEGLMRTYAARDARNFSSVLAQQLRQSGVFQSVVTVDLISDYLDSGSKSKITQRDATKDNLRKVFSVLAGTPGSRLSRHLICNNGHSGRCRNLLAKTTPDDVVIIYVAAHG
jgi:hypothetical protein